MKKLLCPLLCGALALLLAACGGGADDGTDEPQNETLSAAPAYDFHIGIVTDSRTGSEEDWKGAEAVRELYGDEVVTHVTYPDSFAEERYEVIQTITELAEDPRMKAIIVNQAVPGTSEAFRRVKETRPDILCLAGELHEAAAQISAAADLVSDSNFIARGYLMIRNAHELGCDTFVHISFPRHMAYETIALRAAVMRAACEELGMTFAEETAPDPQEVGTPVAQVGMMEKVPEWVAQYGQNAAFFCTNDDETWPLIKKVLECGGFVIEQDSASPANGYPEALDLELKADSGDFASLLKEVEAALVAQGGAGRFGTWVYSYGYVTSAGLARHAINVLTGESELLDPEDITKAFMTFSPGAEWKISRYINPETGEAYPNGILVYEDTYIMGDPGRFMGGASVEIPERYFTIK